MNKFVRKVDSANRIYIPKQVREQLNIKTNTNLELYMSKSTIVLKVYNN
jgi:AbrB family looped-hinge helix DNA binding protein